MSLVQFIAILKARWLIFVTILALCVLTTVGISSILAKQYAANAAVVIDIKSPDPIAGVVLPGIMSPAYMATQLDLAKSERVALKVIRGLRLADSPAMQEQWRLAMKGEGTMEGWLIETLGAKLKVSPSRESNVLNFEYRDPSPDMAANMANAFVQAYISTTSDLRVEPAKEYSASFTALAEQLRVRLEAAQKKLSDYQKKSGLMATDERLDIETARLNELAQQLLQVQALRSDSSTRKSLAYRDGGQFTRESQDSQAIGQLKAELTRQNAQLEDLLSKYGESHPTVKTVRAVIDTLENRLRTEYRGLSKTIDMNDDVYKGRMADSKAALEAQREKLVALREQRASASVLARDVENLQRAYDVVQARAAQSTMESSTTQTNLSVLQVATPPLKAASPNVLLNTAISLFLGTLMAMLVTWLIELLDRRVRSNEDVVRDLQLPLLGVLMKTENAPKRIFGHKAPPWVIGNTSPIAITNNQ